MERHQLLDKIEQIQEANYSKFKGTNEAELHAREEITDLIYLLIKECHTKSSNMAEAQYEFTLDDCLKTLEIK